MDGASILVLMSFTTIVRLFLGSNQLYNCALWPIYLYKVEVFEQITHAYLLHSLSASLSSIAINLSLYAQGLMTLQQRNTFARLKGREPSPQLPPHQEAPVQERTFETLMPGDVVLEGNDDWLIVASCTYREEADTWWLHALEDGERKRFLEVRHLDGLQVSFLQPAPDVPTFGELFSGLTYHKQSYRLKRRGDARTTLSGQVEGSALAPLHQGHIKYTVYVGPGDLVLNVEEHDETRLAFAGERVLTSTLSLMPGAPLATEKPLFDDEGA